MPRLFRCFAALAAVVPLVIMLQAPAQGQGMFSVGGETADASAELAALRSVSGQKVATLQRLLHRLGYLPETGLTGEMDDPTFEAIEKHLEEAKLAANGLTYERLLRSVFSTVWIKEDWGSGKIDGQDIVVDIAEVRSVQESLRKLKYEPGPVDGIFGPASFTAVEIFQEDLGLKVNGLPTRNVTQNIQRAAAFVGKKPKATIHVLNWPDYINPDLLVQFEKETGIRVVHEVFDSSDETKDLLFAKSDKYDLMVQTDSQMRNVLEPGDLVAPLDMAKLPNAANLDPAAMKIVSNLDPGNVHSVPYFWGTVGIGINETLTKPIRPDLNESSMSVFLDPAIAADLSRCGIGMVDEGGDVMSSLVAYTGGDPSNITTSDLEAVEQLITKVAPYIQLIPAEKFIDDLATGKYCAAVGYSGDVFLARDTAKESGVGKITYSVPAEGSQLWFDLIVVPTHAKNPAAAHALINFLMRPEVAGANTNFIQYANANLKSRPFIEEALLKDPGVYPPASVLKRLTVAPSLTPNVEAEIDRIWDKLRKK